MTWADAAQVGAVVAKNSTKGLRSREYRRARRDLRLKLESPLELAEETYAVVESLITGGRIKISKPRGLRSAGTRDVVFLLLTKALKTFRAIRVTVLEGCGQDASVLVRVLFESATALHWILQRNSQHRAALFAAHSDQRLLVMVEEGMRTPGLKRQSKKLYQPAMERVNAWARTLDSDAIGQVRRHWSGTGSLENTVRKLKGWMVAYNTVYRATSSFAHGADPLRHAHYREQKPVFKLLPGDDEAERALLVASTLLYSIGARLNERMGLGLDAEIEALRARIVAIPRRAGQ